MVKIEKIVDAKVFIVRDGTKREVFLHQLITRQELETLQVEGGSVVVSIDEEELKEYSAVASKSTAAPTTEPTLPEPKAPEPKLSVKEKIKAMKAKQQDEHEGP